MRNEREDRSCVCSVHRYCGDWNIPGLPADHTILRSSPMKFVVLMTQQGEGCDYTIACGQEIPLHREAGSQRREASNRSRDCPEGKGSK